tara:strand:+ start:780 stop:953 length:174 start_codon:yes stop_codon:yes gene_type:complete
MFLFLLLGIVIGIFLKETYTIPQLKPLMDKLFEMGNMREMEEEEEVVEKEKEKENAD